MVGSALLPIDLFQEEVVIQKVISEGVLLLLESKGVLGLDLLFCDRAQVVPPNYKVDHADHKLDVRKSFYYAELDLIKGDSYFCDWVEKELKGDEGETKKDRNIEETVNYRIWHYFALHSEPDVLVYDVSQVDDIFQLFSSALVDWKPVNEELFCIFTEVVENRPITEVNGGQFLSKIDLDFFDFFFEVKNDLAIVFSHIFLYLDP